MLELGGKDEQVEQDSFSSRQRRCVIPSIHIMHSSIEPNVSYNSLQLR